MTNVKINDTINLSYPDGFKEMGEAELTKYFGNPDNRWGAYNAEQHVILSVSWAKKGLFADVESKLIEAESRLSRSLLNFQKVTAIDTKIADIKAKGIRFEYRVNDSVMVHIADLIILKHKNMFYSFYLVTRKMNSAAPRLEFAEMLKGITVG